MAAVLDNPKLAVSAASLPPPSATEPLPWSVLLRSLFVQWGLLAATFVLAMWNMGLVVLMMTLMPKNDFGRTFLSAVAFVHGENMYGMNESIPWWIENQSINLWNLNPPHFHLLLLPLVWLGNDIALGVWFVANFACLLLGLKIVAAEVNVEWTGRRRQFAILFLLAFIGMSTAIVTGHMAFLLFLLMTLAWRDARHGRWVRSAVPLALALSVKPFLLFLTPYYLWKRQWRALAVLAGTVGLCYLAGLVVFGVENNRSWLERLRVADSWAWLPMNASIMGLLTRSFSENLWFANLRTLTPQVIKMIWLALVVPLALLSFAAVAPDKSPRGVDRAFGLLLVGSLLVSPLGWTYYFLLGLGPILMLAVSWFRARAAGSTRWTWRQRLLAASLPGFCAPLLALDIGQPFAPMTAIFGSIYCWSLVMVWTALAIDGWCAFRGGAAALPA